MVVESISDIRRLIGCDMFTCVTISDRETIYVDDEGLLKNPQFFFKHSNYPDPLAGNGLILGFDMKSGDSKDTAYLPIDVAKVTEFYSINDLQF